MEAKHARHILDVMEHVHAKGLLLLSVSDCMNPVNFGEHLPGSQMLARSANYTHAF